MAESANIETPLEANTGNENQNEEVQIDANASIGNGQQHIELINEIKKMLTSLEPPLSTDCCIYRVPDYLRKLNEAAYTPKVISIGPFHHGNIRLQTMEKQKLRYLKSFKERAVITLEKLVSTIKQREGSIRRCYREAIQLSSDDFVKMILLDVSFILEIFWKSYYGSFTSDDSRWLICALTLDLVLLENQIPFFTIKELFGLAFPSLSNSSPPLIQLTFDFFSDFNVQNIQPRPNEEIKHFTDLFRTFQLPQTQKLPSRRRDLIKHLYSATQLHEAGVKFKVSSSKCLLDLKFTNGVLQIPSIQLEDKTETLIRNLMAFEHCHYMGETYITDYYIILDFLINTTHDVDLLCKKGIMVNCLGDSNAPASMVNRLNNQIVVWNMSSKYCCLSKALNEFYENPWHNWKATLKREYFSTPWRTASTIAAVILLVLTFIQTVCSIIQLLPKHE